MGKRFEFRTDHISLKYLFDQPNINSRKARWLEYLCEFDFEIKHIKGKENKDVDTPSRKIHVATFSIYKADLKEMIIYSLAKDEFYIQVKDGFQ